MPTFSATAPGWGRVRLLISLVGIVLAVLMLIGGLVVLIADTDRQEPPPRGSAPTRAITVHSGASTRDDIAAAPMLKVTPADARRGTPSATIGDPIEVPPPTTQGPAKVPAGFPHSAVGAIGQLAAIDTTVLSTMSLSDAAAVHDAWTLPGAVPLQGWAPTDAVRSFRAASGTTGPVPVAAKPVAAQVKGTDGADWVLACVLYRVDAAVARAATVAYGRCERLQWQTKRWLVAAGPGPAAAPSTWPGTDLAHAAGWRPWITKGGDN